MAILRKLLFYFLLIVYLVTCPLVILYALGYAYQPGASPNIAKLGVISVSTMPSGASVYLGRSRFTEQTPTVLMDLFPGEYILKIVLEDYRPWIRKIPVRSGKATVLENIILVPTDLRMETVVPYSFDNLIVFPGTPFFLLSKGNKLKELYVLYWRTGKIRPLLPVGSPYAEIELERIFHVRKSPSPIFQVNGEAGEKYLRMNIRGKHTIVHDISHLIPETPDNWVWDPKAEKYLFYLDSGRLDRIDLTSNEISPITDHVQGVGLFDQKIYVVRSNDVIRMDRNGSNAESLLNDPELGAALFKDGKNFECERLKDGVLLFWRKHGELLSNRFPYRLVDDGVLGIEPYRGKPALLIWQKHRVGIIDFSRKPSDSEDVFEKSVKAHWVHENGNDIRQAFWISEGNYILFLDSSGVFLLDAFSDMPPSVRFLFSVKENSSVYYAPSLGKLYYLEPQSGKLRTFELLEMDVLAPVRRSLENDKETIEKVRDGLSFFQSRSE